MWVSIPTVVLLAFLAAQDIAGETAPLILSSSALETEEQGRKTEKNPAISLEYKPIKPSYLSSGSNVAQIVPPGQPWPANAAGYENFSQLNPTKNEMTDDIPLLQSAPTATNMINLDMTNPNANIAEALEKVLAPQLSNVKVTENQQTIPISINITPPPNADMDFVKALQTAVRTAVGKLVPSAGTSLKIAITKASTGAIVNVKAYLDVVVPAAVKKVVPNSNVPEIDLTKGTSGLVQSLQSILLKELLEAGYNFDSQSIQNFALSFSVLPPEGATKDFVRLEVLAPLQTALKNIAPRASITSVSVNTQTSNSRILRQTVKLNVQINPPAEFQMNQNVVEVPEIDLNMGGANLASTVVTTLQNQIMKIANVDPSQAKTLSIPFKITPPAGATQQQIQETYIIPISQVLLKLDPTGKILKLTQKTLSNGDIILVIYMNIPANATTNPEVSTTSTPSTQVPITINNRNSFPEGEEDEIPPEETSESTQIETEVPSNAVKTPTVDLTTPTASVNSIRKILDEELSPLSNPANDGKPKVLAIPFVMKPPAGATLQQIQENVVIPIGKLLTGLEPTGNVVTSQTKSLPDGDVESVVYFVIPSVKNSQTYKVISNDLQKQSTTSTQPPVTAQVPSVSTQTPKVPEGKNPNVVTTPIDLSHPNFDALKNGIEQRLKEVIEKTPNQSGEPQTVGFPFVVPKDQAKRIPVMAQAIATLLKGLVPSGNASPTISPKVLPNGDVEFIIYYEIPSITELNKDVTERPEVAKKGEEKVVLTPIDVKNPDLETLRNELDRKINEITGTAKGKPQQVEIPLVVSKNLKSPFFEIALKNLLQTILPGKVSPKPQYKDLPNGDVEMVFNYETPSTTVAPVVNKNGQTNEVVVSTTLSPKTVSSTTTTPRTQNEVQPQNNNQIAPINIKNPDLQTLGNELVKKINDFTKTTNGQPQEVEIPLVISKNLKSPFFEIALKNFLQTILPGKVSPKPQYKDLPNGDVEMVFNYETPSTTVAPVVNKNGRTNKVVVSTTLSPKIVLSTTTTPKTQNEVQPQNNNQITPINIKNPDLQTLGNELVKKINDFTKTTNGQPQEVEIPLVISKNLKSPFFEIALKNFLQTILPGKVSPKPQYKDLPNGDVEMVFNYETPSTTVAPVVNKNGKTNEALVSTTLSPKIVSSTTTTPKTQKEVQPQNNHQITPINIKNPDLQTLGNELVKKMNDFTKTTNGQPQEVEIPLVISKNLKSPFFEIALKNFLQTILPGKVSPKPQYKDLPNGDVEMVFNYETPSTTVAPVANKNGQTNEAVVSTTPTPKTVSSTTTTPKTQKEVQPQNNNQITPINIKNPDLQTLGNELVKKINDFTKTTNGQPQEVEIPLVISKNLKSPFFEIALKNFLQTILPGKVSPKPQYKDLPNGDVEMVFNYETPSTTVTPVVNKNGQTNEAVVSTTPTPKTVSSTTTTPKTQATTATPITSTSKTQNEINNEKPIIISPINIKTPNFDTLLDEIKKTIEKDTATNDQPQIIGIPFVMPSPPPYLVKFSLKQALKILLPGEVLPETETRNLPDGNVEFIVYYKKPPTTTPVQTEPSVEKKQEPRRVVPPKTALVKPITEAPQTENSVITSPITLQQIDFNTIKDEVEKRIEEVGKTNEGGAEIVGLPFIIPDNKKSYMLELGLKKVLGSILPGEVLPNTQTKTLPNGETELVIFYKKPELENKSQIEPVETLEEVNLDEPGSTVLGEVEKALVQGISTLSSNPENLNKPGKIALDIYAPLDNTPSQNKDILDAVSAEVKTLEPTAEIISAKVNEKPLSNQPDGEIEILLPSIAASKTLETLKNAVKIPTIDTNIPNLNLVGNIKALLQRGLKKLAQINPKGSQLFDLSFRLNPFDTKGSVAEILKALKAVDPSGETVSYKISTRPDGLEYLDVRYLIPRLEDSLIFEMERPEQPEVVYESVVDIDTRNPLSGLLEKVVGEVGSAEDEVKGAKKEQLVDLPLDFKFTNSRGLSDTEVSRIVSQTLPYIQGYLSQVLPDGQVKSIDTVALPNSDDVILKIVVRTPYEPDNTIVIEEERPRMVVASVTTPKPKSKGLFGLFGR